jgi:hypothetical protein
MDVSLAKIECAAHPMPTFNMPHPLAAPFRHAHAQEVDAATLPAVAQSHVQQPDP